MLKIPNLQGRTTKMVTFAAHEGRVNVYLILEPRSRWYQQDPGRHEYMTEGILGSSTSL